MQAEVLMRIQAHNIVMTTDPLGRITTFTYDAAGNVTSTVDADGNKTEFDYEATFNKVTARTDALNRQKSYQYDPTGNLSQFTDRKAQVSTFTYDALNRRTEVQYVDATTTFSYDSIRRLAQATDSTSGTIEFVYDNVNRLIQEITPQGAMSYQYDALGRRTSMTTNGQQPVTYQYDAASRLTQVVQCTQIVGLGYDATGRRTSLTYPNGTGTTYTYDAASRLLNIVHQGPGSTVIDTLTYTYDAASNRLSLTRANAAATLLPNAVASATYDAANQQQTFGGTILTYDQNGNLSSDGINTYQWDARNRVTSLTGTMVAGSFQYDVMGRRIKKTVSGVTTEFAYDGNDITSEIVGASMGASYLRDLVIDQPFIRQSSVTEYYFLDPLGSTLALTDGGGTESTTYAYEPFGQTTSSGTSDNPFQFTGRERDSTGLYYFRNRQYSPKLQRFLSEDPIIRPMTFFNSGCSVRTVRSAVWPVPAFINGPAPLLDPTKITSPFIYVRNNPILLNDPMGLDPKPPCNTGGLFQCRTGIRRALAGAACGVPARACAGLIISGAGAPAAVPVCSLALGLCVGVFVYTEVNCLIENNCITG